MFLNFLGKTPYSPSVSLCLGLQYKLVPENYGRLNDKLYFLFVLLSLLQRDLLSWPLSLSGQGYSRSILFVMMMKQGTIFCSM